MTIYKNIKEIAKRKNIQQKDIAEAFGVTENTMTNYLTGRTKITADQIPLFAKVLRVSIEELFKDGKEQKPYKLPEEKLVVVEDKPTICAACVAKDKLIALQEKHIELLEFNLGKYRKNGSE